jgi:origin recognition complex subunit 5
MDANLLPAFLRLQELTKLPNLCVFLLSDVVWEKFRIREGFQEPIQIHFPQYTKGMAARDLCVKRGCKIRCLIITVRFQINSVNELMQFL